MIGLDAQLQGLLDKQAIHDLVVAYFHGIDTGDVELVASTYHPDAVDERGPRRLEGPGIAEELVRSNGQSMTSMRHHVTTHRIEISGDTATSVAYCLGVHVTAGDEPKRLQTAGRYLDRLDRRDGEWRIVEREMVIDMLRAEPLDRKNGR
jgi:ketosteroid isomerase-like protein